MNGEAVLEARGLSSGYEQREVLHGVDLRVAAGDMIALLGPNGSGKSTLVRALAGVLPVRSGQVLLYGRPLRAYRRREIARHIAVVPQMSSIMFSFTALEFVMMGRTPHLGRLQAETARDREIATQAMRDMDAEYLRDRPVTELSGGELQRLVIARSLAQQTPILLLDEPTAFLDINHQLEILRLLRRLNAEQRKTILCVSHDLNLTAAFFDRIALMKDGRIVAQGTPEAIVTARRIEEIYGARVLVDQAPTGRPRVTVTDGPAAGDAS